MKNSLFSIKTTIFLGIFLGISIPIFIASTYTINLNKTRLYDKFKEYRIQTLKDISKSMIDPLYNFAPSNGSLALEIIKQNKDIIKIKIYDEISEAEFITINIPYRHKANKYKEKQDIYFNKEKLGWVEITYSDYSLLEELNERKKSLIGIFAFTFLALFLIMYPLLYFKLLVPLKRLLNQSKDFKNSNFSKKYFWRANDEIGQIGQTLDLAKDSIEENEIKLIEAKNKALKETKVKSEFLANMSHEIRTPLNGVLGLAKLLLASNLNEKQKDYLQKMVYSSESLLNILNDILDYSKIEVGKLTLENRSFNIHNLIHNIEALFIFSAKQKGIKLSFEIDKNIPEYLIGDNFRLQQIFNNLISNAIKFTSKGEIKISINIKKIIQSNIELFIYVQDSGIGIKKEDKEKIFKSFEQADNSNTRKHGGTGLGLSITKQIVELMGGEIWLESEENKGSKFYFTIKTKYDDKIKKKQKDENYILKTKAKALVVEDNTINQLIVKENLKIYGIDSLIASNGLEALEILKKQSFDLIFMDIHMPIMDGIECTKKIRQDKINTPIIALSASTMKEDINKAKQVGINKYIAKPIVWDEIEEILEQYLQVEYIKIDSKEDLIKEDLIEIKGLDINETQDALQMPAQKIYELLENFKDNYKDFENDLKDLDINSKDFDKSIHKLKGISANLHINEIYHLCKELEENKEITKIQKLIEKVSILTTSIQKNISNKKKDIELLNKNELEKHIQDLIIDIDEFNYIEISRIDILISSLKDYKTDLKILFDKNEDKKLKDELLKLLKKEE